MAAPTPTNQKPQDVLALAQSIRQTYAEADRLSQSLGLESRTIKEAIEAMQKLASINASTAQTFDFLSKSLGINQQQFDGLLEAQKRYQAATLELAKDSKSSLEQIGEGVGRISSAYLGAAIALQQLANSGKETYDLIIGQNVHLQEQLLATQASLASTNKVIVDGQEIKDPTAAIQALSAPVNQAIAELRKGSFDLVGVTSNDLIPLFQSVAGESAKIGANLQQSTKIALGFGAASQTLKIPMQQVNNELKLILDSQISSENRLASALNLNNETVNRWKSQGIFVDELNKKLETFRAGNALGAQTIGGISANIKELFLEFGRLAGEPFLSPLVAQLNTVYSFLKDNRESIISFTSGITQFFLEIGSKLGEIFTTLEPIFKNLAETIGNNLNADLEVAENTIKTILDLAGDLAKIAEPILELVSGMALELSKINDSPFGKIALESGALLLVLNLLKPALVGVAMEALSLVEGGVVLASTIGEAAIALGGFEGIAATLATGGIPALQAALVAAIPELGAFGAATVAALTPLLPIIALGGAIALTLELKTIGDLNQANEELEEYRKQVDEQGESTLNLARKMKVLADSRKANGSLTEEEEKQSKKLQAQQQNEIASINDKIASIKQLQNLSPEQEATRKAQIDDLQNQIKLLQKYSEGTKLQAKDLHELGNTYQQLGNKVNDALSKFDHPTTDKEFKEAAQDIIKYTQEQLKAGIITQQQAEARLAKVRDNTKVEVDVQQSANEAIIKSRDESLNHQVELSKIAQEKIKALIDGEVIGNFEGQQRILAAKKQQLETEIAATKSAIEKEEALRESQVNKELARIGTEIQASQKRLEAVSGGSSPDDKQKQRLEKQNLDRLNAQREAAQASLKIETDAGIKLKTQLQSQESELSSVVSQSLKGRRDEELKEFDERQKILDEKNVKRLISEGEYNRESLNLTQQRGNAELAQLQEQASKLGSGNEKTRLAIAAKEAELRVKIANATEKFYEQQSKNRLAQVDAEQKELAAKYAEGLVNQQDFNQQSLNLNLKKNDEELAEIQRQKARTLPADKQRLEELAGQEAEILKKRSDARASFEDTQVKLIQESQTKALAVVSQSEADRLVTVTQLESKFAIRKEEAEQKKLAITSVRIKQEIAQEKDKLAQLEALPAYTDPEKERTRQAEIDASRLKATNLVKSLLDNEKQQREALFAVIEAQLKRQVEAIQNVNAATQLELDKQKDLINLQTQSLGIEQQLLQAKQSLINSQNSLYQNELNILKETSQNETEKKQIAESAALINLKNVQAQAKIEQQILDFKKEERDIALEMERISLRAKQAEAKANTADAKANVALVESDPNATPEQKDAAKLKYFAAVQKEGAINLEGTLIDKKAQLNAAQDSVDQQNLDNKNLSTEDSALLNLAKNRVNPFDQQQDTENLRKRIFGRFGVTNSYDNSGEIKKYGENVGFNPNIIPDQNSAKTKVLQDQLFAVLNQQIRSGGQINSDLASQSMPAFKPVQSVLPTIMDTSAPLPIKNTNDKSISPSLFNESAINSAIDKMLKKATPANITITNNFSGNEAESGKAAQANVQQMRKELKDILILAENQ